jgi:hypothetical protein
MAARCVLEDALVGGGANRCLNWWYVNTVFFVQWKRVFVKKSFKILHFRPVVVRILNWWRPGMVLKTPWSVEGWIGGGIWCPRSEVPVVGPCWMRRLGCCHGGCWLKTDGFRLVWLSFYTPLTENALSLLGFILVLVCFILVFCFILSFFEF